jgi:hypothetical protein
MKKNSHQDKRVTPTMWASTNTHHMHNNLVDKSFVWVRTRNILAIVKGRIDWMSLHGLIIFPFLMLIESIVSFVIQMSKLNFSWYFKLKTSLKLFSTHHYTTGHGPSFRKPHSKMWRYSVRPHHICTKLRWQWQWLWSQTRV